MANTQDDTLKPCPVTEEIEAIARIINPGAWAVMDRYLADRGGAALWHPDQFKHKESMAVARQILAMQAASPPTALAQEVERLKEALGKSRSWIFKCWGWLMETDLDMTCPMETDPLDIVEAIDALLGIAKAPEIPNDHH